jgi:ADP-ribose pyrophosphatase YjhB (NUDIX family)
MPLALPEGWVRPEDPLREAARRILRKQAELEIGGNGSASAVV